MKTFLNPQKLADFYIRGVIISTAMPITKNILNLNFNEKRLTIKYQKGFTWKYFIESMLN